MFISSPSAYGVSAIYRERVPDHQACGGAAKPKNSISNLLGATNSTDRYIFHHLS